MEGAGQLEVSKSDAAATGGGSLPAGRAVDCGEMMADSLKPMAERFTEGLDLLLVKKEGAAVGEECEAMTSTEVVSGKRALWLVLCDVEGRHIADVKLVSPTEIRGDRGRLAKALLAVSTVLDAKA
jgi:hypothetical protein